MEDQGYHDVDFTDGDTKAYNAAKSEGEKTKILRRISEEVKAGTYKVNEPARK